jgi:holo-[acyl-carrier protein] synthase
MDTIGIGTDIIECVRIRRMIEKHGELFLKRVFTEQEILDCQSRTHATEHFAGHWAAKEAVLKSLGANSTKDLCWTEIEVRTEPEGPPRVVLYGAIRDLAQSQQISQILISFSHCRMYAVAFATALCHVGDED